MSEQEMKQDVWRGTTADGKRVEIDHKDLMVWALENDRALSIGWGDSVTMPCGTKLTRFRAKQGKED